MKVVHLINKLKIDYDPRTRGPYDTKHEGLFRTDARDIYVSCCWDFNSEEAMQLVGGRIYLHHTKKEKSFMGGVVTKVTNCDLRFANKYFDPQKQKIPSRFDRVYIEFQSTSADRHVWWNLAGQSHPMAWTTGIIDKDDS